MEGTLRSSGLHSQHYFYCVLKTVFIFEAGKSILPNMWFKHFKSVKGYNRRNLNFVCMWYSCVLVQVCASVHEWVYMCICRVQRTISGYPSLCIIYLVFYRWVFSFSSKPQRSACLFLPRVGWHVCHHVRFCFMCGFGTKSRFFFFIIQTLYWQYHLRSRM